MQMSLAVIHLSENRPTLTNKQTCIWPGPPWLDESDPERSLCQQSTGEVCEDVIIEDGQTAVVRQTSVDCCEPGNVLSVNLVTCRIVYDAVVASRVCSYRIQCY